MALADVFADAARSKRCVFIAGLPGAGKTVLVRMAASLARESGRRVALLQWDVLRLPFDAPGILARYPEVGGVTHAAIRLAASAWARRAVARWDREADRAAILVGETPLGGERLMELARPRDDDAEALLASDATAFLIAVPTAEVRAAIERSRARDVVARTRDGVTSAPPHLVQAHWDELMEVAAALGLARTVRYDPDVYAATYLRLLRHRHARVVVIDRLAPSAVPPVDDADQLVPTDDEVREAMATIERLGMEEIDRRARTWYRV